MIPRDELACIIMAIILCLLLAPCASGPPGPPGPPPVDNVPERLSWVQPPLFADNTPLVLTRDIGLYEIHASDNAAFSDNTIAAIVKPVDVLGSPSHEFDLRNLRQFGIQPGPLGTFVTVRSVGVDNACSDFGEPAYWEEVK